MGGLQDYKLRKQKKELAEEKEKVIPEEINIKSEPEISEPPLQPMTKIVEVDEIVQFDMFDNL